MEIKTQHLPKGSKKRSGRRINPEFITIHSTGNSRSTAQNERDYLSNPINTNSTGWHYVVGDNIIIEAIPPNERAWHAGDGSNGPGNNKSIGIEMVETGNRSKVIQNTIKLTKHLQSRFNIPDSNVVRHHDWSGKNCPRILNYNNWQGWVEFKTMLRSGIMNEKRVREIVNDEVNKLEDNKRKKPAGKWAEEPIKFVIEHGIMEGYEDGSFGAKANVTREELATTLFRFHKKFI